MRRPRLLQVTRNLPPLRGGMERLNLRMAEELAEEFDLFVIGPMGCRATLSERIAVSELTIKPLWHFFLSVLLQATRTARRWRPQVVLAGSGLTAPFAWIAGRCVGAKVVVYVHGLDLVVRHPLYRFFWLPFIRHADLCIANSINTSHLAHAAGVIGERTAVVHPGIDVPAAASVPNDFRVRFNLGSRPILLSVGRLIARKGLVEFVERSLSTIARHIPDVCLVVIGEEAPDLLQGRSLSIVDHVRRSAVASGLEGNIRLLGALPDEILTMAYRAADAHIFPIRDVPGDVEGFGMVAAEAAAHGLWTVAFATGGVPDAVGDGVSGMLVPQGDYAGFARAVVDVLAARGDAAKQESARQYALRFRWDAFGVKLRGLLNRFE